MEAMKQHLMEQAKEEREKADTYRDAVIFANAHAVKSAEKAIAHEAMALECERLAAQYDVPVAPEWAKEFVPDSVNAQHVGWNQCSHIMTPAGTTLWEKNESPSEEALRASSALTGYGADASLAEESHADFLARMGNESK